MAKTKKETKKVTKKSKYLKKESYNTKPMCKRKTNLRCPGNRT